jgi:hypothetical protein
VPDRNQVTIVGMELPAFQLSKNVLFRFHRNAPGSLERAWRDLRDREELDLAFQRNFQGRNAPKNKKPGVERRAQPPTDSVAPREARQSATRCS